MAGRRRFRPGERVEWETSQGTTVGRVVKRLTSAVRIKGHRVAASPDNPEYLVRSEKSDREAAHKPAALRRRKG
jgi:hypothetical protein